jgi:hypothetical protein
MPRLTGLAQPISYPPPVEIAERLGLNSLRGTDWVPLFEDATNDVKLYNTRTGAVRDALWIVLYTSSGPSGSSSTCSHARVGGSHRTDGWRAGRLGHRSIRTVSRSEPPHSPSPPSTRAGCFWRSHAGESMAGHRAWEPWVVLSTRLTGSMMRSRIRFCRQDSGSTTLTAHRAVDQSQNRAAAHAGCLTWPDIGGSAAA